MSVASSQSLYSGPPFTLIMIEDDPGHASLIRKNLARSGLRNPCLHFTCGAQALDYIMAAEDRDQMLILLDLNLPDIEGHEVLRRLKTKTATRLIPVIVLTTTEDTNEIDRCYALGCNMYITKPVDYDSFADAMSKLGLMLSAVKLPNATNTDVISRGGNGTQYSA
jgi:CheY-like chemotaxis protein